MSSLSIKSFGISESTPSFRRSLKKGNRSYPSCALLHLLPALRSPACILRTDKVHTARTWTSLYK